MFLQLPLRGSIPGFNFFTPGSHKPITLRISRDPATHGGNILSDVRVIGAHLQVKGTARMESSLRHWNESCPPQNRYSVGRNR